MWICLHIEASIQYCVHVIKFVIGEMHETALWKTVFKFRQVSGIWVIPVYSAVAEVSTQAWNVPTTQLCDICFFVPVELKWNNQETGLGTSTIPVDKCKALLLNHPI